MSSPALQFDESTHIYTLRGQRIESVTQVIDGTGLSDYKFLPDSVREEALWRGKIVHGAISLDMAGELDESSVPPEYIGFVLAARRFRMETGFVPDRREHADFHPVHKYAGTIDAEGIADLGQGRKRYILDWKTGAAPRWVKYQLAAYAAFFPSPGAILRLCVELHGDTTFRVIELSPADFRADLDVFLSALTVERVKHLPKFL